MPVSQKPNEHFVKRHLVGKLKALGISGHQLEEATERGIQFYHYGTYDKAHTIQRCVEHALKYANGELTHG